MWPYKSSLYVNQKHYFQIDVWFSVNWDDDPVRVQLSEKTKYSQQPKTYWRSLEILETRNCLKTYFLLLRFHKHSYHHKDFQTQIKHLISQTVALRGVKHATLHALWDFATYHSAIAEDLLKLRAVFKCDFVHQLLMLTVFLIYSYYKKNILSPSHVTVGMRYR